MAEGARRTAFRIFFTGSPISSLNTQSSFNGRRFAVAGSRYSRDLGYPNATAMAAFIPAGSAPGMRVLRGSTFPGLFRSYRGGPAPEHIRHSSYSFLIFRIKHQVIRRFHLPQALDVKVFLYILLNLHLYRNLRAERRHAACKGQNIL